MAIVLRVSLSSGDIRTEAVAADVLERYVGGRGVGTKLLLDHGDPALDAYDPKNPLIFATGPLTGTFAPTQASRSVRSIGVEKDCSLSCLM